MNIPNLGAVTKENEFDSLYSEPISVNAFGGKECRIIVEGYEDDPNKEDFHVAIGHFLAIDDRPLKQAAEHIFAYYKFCAANFEIEEYDGFPIIESALDIWPYIQLGTEVVVSRREYGDEGIYVSVECECDWEVEHGLQIVFKNGLTVNKVGAYDGHHTNSDAYDDKSLENVIFH